MATEAGRNRYSRLRTVIRDCRGFSGDSALLQGESITGIRSSRSPGAFAATGAFVAET
jgi:hypothetical protein